MIIVLSVIVPKFHCDINTQNSKAIISNIYAFQLPRRPQEEEKISYENVYLTSSQGLVTTNPKAKRLQIGVLSPIEISESNLNFSHTSLPQESYSNGLNYSLTHSLKNHQVDSNYFVPNMRETPNVNLKQLNTGQLKDQISHVGYILEKNQNPDSIFAQQENSGLTKTNVNHNSKLNADSLHSKRVKKVPIVLITIQKETNSQKKGESNTDFGPQTQYSYHNTLNHKQNYSDYVDLHSKEHANYKPSLLTNISENHQQTIKKLLNVELEANSPREISNNFANKPIENDNMFEYSIPQNEEDNSQALEWKPMDGSRFKKFEDNVAISGYSQDQSNQNNGNTNRESHNIQYKSPFLEEINPFHSKAQMDEPSSVQQPNSYHAIVSLSGTNSHQRVNSQDLKQSILYNNNSIRNKQQMLLPHKSVEGNSYQRQNGRDSGTRIDFQNVTFPSNIKENSNVLPQLVTGTYVQTGALQLNSHPQSHPNIYEEYKTANSEKQRPMQAISIVQNQNSGYLMADYIKSSLVNSQNQYTSLSNKPEKSSIVYESNNASQTEIDFNLQIPSTHELHASSNNENSNTFINKDSNMMYPDFHKFHPFVNQNVQSFVQNTNQKISTRTPTNKPLTHSDGYIIFPLDDKYIVQNNGQSGKNYNIILTQRSTAYGPVMKLMMNNNPQQTRANIENIDYSFNKETEEKNFDNDANLNYNQATDAGMSSNYKYNDDPSPAYDLNRDEMLSNTFIPASNSYINPEVNFRMLPNQMSTESETSDDTNYRSENSESIQPEIVQDTISTSSESNENRNNGYENFQKQFSMNYEPHIRQNADYRSPEIQNVYQNMNKKRLENDAIRSLNQAVYDRNPVSNTNDGSSKYENYYQNSASSDPSDNSYIKLNNKLRHNFGIYSMNQHTSDDFGGKELVASLAKSSNSSELDNISKNPKKGILGSSSPEALLLVLVSSKNAHPINYHNNDEGSSTEEGNESSAVKVVELLKQNQNAKSLIQSFYSSATRDKRQESTDDLNKKFSPNKKEK
ncbi:uncharacterized protein NPIL_393441 [Nephila pilipes]|uniref:Uncharacterized protein n=1 Tax=Nephila pilipes TaxID=299642 RepID=A0A8X6T9E2_NEPPI|nr:uncharacterized protein NPIL_393441 [Nephila pilipes]